MTGILHSVMGVVLITVVMETEAYIAYMPRSVGVADDPCGPTLDAMRAAGETGLPNSPYIPPPKTGTAGTMSAPADGIYNPAHLNGIYNPTPSDPYIWTFPNANPKSASGTTGTAQTGSSGVLGTSETGSGSKVEATHLPGVVHRVSGNVFSASIVSENSPSSQGKVNAVIGSADPTETGSSQQSRNANPGVDNSQPTRSRDPSNGSVNTLAGGGNTDPTEAGSSQQSWGANPGVGESRQRSRGSDSSSANPTAYRRNIGPTQLDATYNANSQRSGADAGMPNSNIPTFSFSVSGGAQISSSTHRRQKRIKRQAAYNPGGYNFAGAHNAGHNPAGYNPRGGHHPAGYNPAGGHNPDRHAIGAPSSGGYNTAGQPNPGGNNLAGAYYPGEYNPAGPYNPGGYNPNHAALLDYDFPEYYYVPGGGQPYAASAGIGAPMVNPDAPDMPYGGYPMQAGYPPASGNMYPPSQPYPHYGPSPMAGGGPMPYSLHGDMPDMPYGGYYGAPIDPHTAALLDLDMPPGMPPPGSPRPAYPPPRFGHGHSPMTMFPAPPSTMHLPNLLPRNLPQRPNGRRRSSVPTSGARSIGSSMRGPPYDLSGPDGRQNADPRIFATSQSSSRQPNPSFRKFGTGNGGTFLGSDASSNAREIANSVNAQEAATRIDLSVPPNIGGPVIRQGISRTGRKLALDAVHGTARSQNELPNSISQAAPNDQQNRRVASRTVTSPPPLPVSPRVNNFNPTASPPSSDTGRQPSQYGVNTIHGSAAQQPRTGIIAPQAGVRHKQGPGSANGRSGVYAGGRVRGEASIGRGDARGFSDLGGAITPVRNSGGGADRAGSAAVGIVSDGVGLGDRASAGERVGAGTANVVKLGARGSVGTRSIVRQGSAAGAGSGTDGGSNSDTSGIVHTSMGGGKITRAKDGSGISSGNNAGRESVVGTAGQQSSNGTEFIAKISFQPGPADMVNGKHSPATTTGPEYGPIPWVAEPLPSNPFLPNQQAQQPSQESYQQPYQQRHYDPFSYLYQDPYYQYYNYGQHPFHVAQNDPWNLWGYAQPFGDPYYYQPYATSYANQENPSSDPYLWPGGETGTSTAAILSGQGTAASSTSVSGQASTSAQQAASLNPKISLGAKGKPVSDSSTVSASEPHGKITIVGAVDRSRTPRSNAGSGTQSVSRSVSSSPVDSQSGNAGNRRASPESAVPLNPYTQPSQNPYSHYAQDPHSPVHQNPYANSQSPYGSNPHAAYQPFANVDIYAVPQEPLNCYCELASECNMEATSAGAHYARQCDGTGNFVCCCRR